MEERHIDDRLAALLRGEAIDWQPFRTETASKVLLDRANYHGVVVMLADILGGEAAVPDAVAAALREWSIFAFGWEAEHRRLIADLLDRLDAAGIGAILFKGTALAYSAYPDPTQRMRGDTDLLVAEGDRDAAQRVLGEAGYRDLLSFDDAEVTSESGHVIVGTLGTEHMVDLHWDVTNSSFLTGLFTFEDLRARVVSLPALSPKAAAPAPVDALMIACVHRQKHLQSPYYVDGKAHYSADRLIWLRDIDLLARGLSGADWAGLVRQAGELGLVGVCFDGVESAGRVFGTPMHGALAEAKSVLTAKERPARYLDADAAGREWMDFGARQGLAAKLGYLRRVFFPPAAYMRERYPESAGAPLAWLYLRRVALGIVKRVRRAG